VTAATVREAQLPQHFPQQGPSSQPQVQFAHPQQQDSV
jgi:hypothetical protein